MARAWVQDLWTQDAIVTLPDGTTTRIAPSAAQLKSLKSLPDHFRTARYGRGKRWRVGWYETVNGLEKMRSKSFDVKGRAEAFASELEDDIRSGRYVDPSLRLRRFRDAADTWFASKATIKPASRRRYRRELDNYVLPKWGDARVGQITREQIDAWVRELQGGTAPCWFAGNEGRDAGDLRYVAGKLSPAYIQHLVGRTFGGTLGYILKEGWIQQNPLADVELPRIEPNLEDDLPSLTYQAVEMLAAQAEEVAGLPDDRALAYLLMYGGPRIGEATAFKVKDFDYAGRRVRVRRTWSIDEAGERIIGAPKNWEARWVPVPRFLAELLRELAKGRKADDWLFQAKRGGPIHDRNWYNRVWVKMRSKTGLATGYSVHDLRHVAATFAISAGADVKLVQRMLGHKDATETLNTYAALWPDKVQEVAEIVERRRAVALNEQQDGSGAAA